MSRIATALTHYSSLITHHSALAALVGSLLISSLGLGIIMPTLDAAVADASPAVGRGRVQDIYNGVSTFGSFLSAMLCTVLYGWQPLAPFVLLTGVVGLTVAAGGLLMVRARCRALRTA